MQYDEPSENEIIHEKPLDDYFDGSEHSSFRKRNVGHSMTRRFGRADLPMILIGIIVLVLVVFLIVVAMNSGGADGDVRIVDLENRLKKAEDQIVKLEEENEQLKLIELQEKKLSLLTDRVGRLEGEIALKWRQVEKKPDTPLNLNAKIEAPAKGKTVAVKKPVVTKKSANKIHHVKTGETMFSIAKQHGLSVDALRRLNPFLKGNEIFPGQQLKIAAQ